MPSHSPVVSVCTSAYNTEQYVATAISSVLDQTLDDVELVILDNASTDRTGEIIAGFADERIHPLQVDANLGASGGRARAIEAAAGEWVAVLDSDDWMDPERLERLVELGERRGADVVADDVHLIDDGADGPWGTLFTAGYHGIEAECAIDAATFVASDRWLEPGLRLGLTKPLFRRSFLMAHPGLRPDPGLTVVHDYWWVLHALLSGATFWLTPMPGYYYRAREGQMVTSGVELETLDQQIDMAAATLTRPEVEADPALTAALTGSREHWRDARAHLQFLQALRSRHVRQAASIARHHPNVAITTLRNLPSWVRRQVASQRFDGHMTRRF